MSMKEESIVVDMYHFFYQNEDYPNIVNNLMIMTIVGMAIVIVVPTAWLSFGSPHLDGLYELLFIILMFGGIIMFIVGGIASFVAFICAWYFLKGT